MSKDIAKDYYIEILDKFNELQESNSFSQMLLNSIKAGENKLYQKHLSQTRVFDGNWVEKIESYMQYIDAIIRRPRTFIKNEENIVPVERAKKITPESIRHLAANTQNIKAVENGMVIPNKVLTIHRETDYAIYENRFVKSLINKLILFIEKRYDAIKDLVGTDYSNKLRTVSTFTFDDAEIEYEVNMTVKKKINDTELEKNNYTIIDRCNKLRETVFGFNNSTFMKELTYAKPVYPPIQQTNIIMKDVNYRACYQLWIFLDAYDKLDYSLDLYEREIQFTNNYIDNLYKSIMFGFTTIISNDESNLGEVKHKANVLKKEKKAKIIKSLITDEVEDTQIDLEKNNFNEYYFQEAKKLYSKQVKKAVNEGEPLHTSIENVWKLSNKMTEDIIGDLLKMPKLSKDNFSTQLRHQLRKKDVVKQVINFQKRDNKKMEKEYEKVQKDIVKTKEKIKVEKAKEQEKIKKEKLKKLADAKILRSLEPNALSDVNLKEVLETAIKPTTKKSNSKTTATKSKKVVTKVTDENSKNQKHNIQTINQEFNNDANVKQNIQENQTNQEINNDIKLVENFENINSDNNQTFETTQEINNEIIVNDAKLEDIVNSSNDDNIIIYNQTGYNKNIETEKNNDLRSEIALLDILW